MKSSRKSPMNLRKRLAFTLVVAGFVASPLLGSNAMADNGLVMKESSYSVGETIDRLQKVLESKGLTIFARIDHAAGAEKAGLELKPEQVLIFGNPKLGTPLMAASPTVGIDLPQKALSYEDADGKVWLVYNNPQMLVDRHNIEGRDEVIGKITGALDKLTGAALQ